MDRIRPLERLDALKVQYIESQTAKRERTKVSKVLKEAEKQKKAEVVEAFRKKVTPISRILQNALHIAPTKHATLGNIRSYLYSKKLIQFKQKKIINEEHVIMMWEKHAGPLQSPEDESL